MEELYRVKGELNSGFVGQITYTICLPYKCSELDICLKFSKQHFPSADMVPSEGCIMPESLEGVLKVTVLVFNVLMDETPYEVSVKAQRGESDV